MARLLLPLLVAAGVDPASGAKASSLLRREPDCSHVPSYEAAKAVVDHMQQTDARVLLFGWLGCPCVQVAQQRFAARGLCLQERTWANPSDPLMAYLQCLVSDPNSHSFIFFREADDSWSFKGNGFAFDEQALTDEGLSTMLSTAQAQTTCGQEASGKKNVYGSALEECRQGTDPQGSWRDDGTCTEAFGGVHQICLESLPKDFSQRTGQPPWSVERAGKRHCVCIGAWSLYMTKEKDNPVLPHCKAIPETALTDTYLANWKDWNGISADIKAGVGKLVEKCLGAGGASAAERCGLKRRFEALRGKEPELAGVKPAGLQALSC